MEVVSEGINQRALKLVGNPLTVVYYIVPDEPISSVKSSIVVTKC